MNKKRSWPIGEFASFELKEDDEKEEFTIILKGKLKYSDLIALKIDEIEITEEDIRREEEESGKVEG